MKRTIYGPEKREALVEMLFHPLLDEPKARGNNFKKAIMRESRPSGGYPRYWERRERPY